MDKQGAEQCYHQLHAHHSSELISYTACIARQLLLKATAESLSIAAYTIAHSLLQVSHTNAH
eukprot:563-Heterococcus_DN1.PRE.2